METKVENSSELKPTSILFWGIPNYSASKRPKDEGKQAIREPAQQAIRETNSIAYEGVVYPKEVAAEYNNLQHSSSLLKIILFPLTQGNENLEKLLADIGNLNGIVPQIITKIKSLFNIELTKAQETQVLSLLKDHLVESFKDVEDFQIETKDNTQPRRKFELTLKELLDGVVIHLRKGPGDSIFIDFNVPHYSANGRILKDAETKSYEKNVSFSIAQAKSENPIAQSHGRFIIAPSRNGFNITLEYARCDLFHPILIRLARLIKIPGVIEPTSAETDKNIYPITIAETPKDNLPYPAPTEEAQAKYREELCNKMWPEENLSVSHPENDVLLFVTNQEGFKRKTEGYLKQAEAEKIRLAEKMEADKKAEIAAAERITKITAEVEVLHTQYTTLANAGYNIKTLTANTVTEKLNLLQELDEKLVDLVKFGSISEEELNTWKEKPFCHEKSINEKHRILVNKIIDSAKSLLTVAGLQDIPNDLETLQYRVIQLEGLLDKILANEYAKRMKPFATINQGLPDDFKNQIPSDFTYTKFMQLINDNGKSIKNAAQNNLAKVKNETIDQAGKLIQGILMQSINRLGDYNDEYLKPKANWMLFWCTPGLKPGLIRAKQHRQQFIQDMGTLVEKNIEEKLKDLKNDPRFSPELLTKNLKQILREQLEFIIKNVKYDVVKIREDGSGIDETSYTAYVMRYLKNLEAVKLGIENIQGTNELKTIKTLLTGNLSEIIGGSKAAFEVINTEISTMKGNGQITVIDPKKYKQ